MAKLELVDPKAVRGLTTVELQHVSRDFWLLRCKGGEASIAASGDNMDFLRGWHACAICTPGNEQFDYCMVNAKQMMGLASGAPLPPPDRREMRDY